jgi:23S rRNA (guanosine2251-2'-O)-methyltransferase
MKPPHGNRPGGSSRPPSDRGPYRGPGGQSSRPPGGSGPHAGNGGGHGGFGQRDHQKPRHQGAPHGGPGGKHTGGQGGGHGSNPRDGGSGGFKPHRDDHGGRPFRPREQGGGPRPAETPRGAVWLYGHHAVAAALANPARRLRRLLLTEEAEAAISKQLSPPWALSPERVERARLDQMLGRDAVHQGAALLADLLITPSLQSVLERPGVIVVLDQVTDPRNVGAIMRSAAAFGAAAIITQDRNAPEETGSLAKAASGALETLPLLRAVNIARTIIALKAANVWCIGLDAAGKPLSGPDFADRRVALVLGAEGEGLRRLTRETCDEIAGLTIKGAVESLNVSAAASVALYELTRR